MFLKEYYRQLLAEEGNLLMGGDCRGTEGISLEPGNQSRKHGGYLACRTVLQSWPSQSQKLKTIWEVRCVF